MMKDVTQDVKFYDRANVETDLKIYAAYGVTAVAVAGTDKDVIFDIRNDLRKTRPTMARVFTSGQGLVFKGGYGGLLVRSERAGLYPRRSAQGRGGGSRQGRRLHQDVGR